MGVVALELGFVYGASVGGDFDEEVRVLESEDLRGEGWGWGGRWSGRGGEDGGDFFF
jgi:hypothetical protein